ncbi:MAG: hypothetical protein ACLT2T_15500 [Bilophila wadsworthia]
MSDIGMDTTKWVANLCKATASALHKEVTRLPFTLESKLTVLIGPSGCGKVGAHQHAGGL